MVACKKTETIQPEQPIKQYRITYFVQCDSAWVEFTIGDLQFSKAVSNWDTTFTAPGGWYYTVMVYGYSPRLLTGVVVDGDTVDGCRGGNYCLMNDYLP